MKLLNGKGRLKAAGDNVTGSPSRVDAFAGFVPRAIVIYFTFQLAVRLMLSSNLEIDESSFVGAVDWKLGYGDSQPPLYNWLVILFVGVFRYWPAIAILKYVLLGTTFLLVYDTARRSSGSRVTAATSALALAFVYQLIWQSQFTLAHSVLSVAAAAATLHAFVLILQKGRVRDFVWLGVAVSAGLLSKYNFAIFFLSAGLAGWSIRDFRHAFHRRTSLISVAVIAATFLPHGLWAIAHYGVTTARLSRLEEDSVFSQLRLSLRGIDGLGSLLWSFGSATLPMVCARMIAVRVSRRRETQSNGRSAEDGEALFPASANAIREFCGRTVMIAIALSAITVIAGNLHSVPERYITVIVIPFSIWLFLAHPLAAGSGAPLAYGGLSASFALCAALLLPVPALLGNHPFAYPYKEMAGDLDSLAAPPFAIFSSRREHAANIAIRLPKTEVFRPARGAKRVLLLWSENEGEKPLFLPTELRLDYAPVGRVTLLRHPYAFWSGKEARLLAQVWERKSSAPAPPNIRVATTSSTPREALKSISAIESKRRNAPSLADVER